MTIAWAAVLLYPVGCFALNAVILISARVAIKSKVPTPLSSASSFLHREYDPSVYWWEVSMVYSNTPSRPPWH